MNDKSIEQLRNLGELLARCFCVKPLEVLVSATQNHSSPDKVEVMVEGWAPEDYPKLIGKNARNLYAVDDILKTAGSRKGYQAKYGVKGSAPRVQVKPAPYVPNPQWNPTSLAYDLFIVLRAIGCSKRFTIHHKEVMGRHALIIVSRKLNDFDLISEVIEQIHLVFRARGKIEGADVQIMLDYDDEDDSNRGAAPIQGDQ